MVAPMNSVWSCVAMSVQQRHRPDSIIDAARIFGQATAVAKEKGHRHIRQKNACLQRAPGQAHHNDLTALRAVTAAGTAGVDMARARQPGCVLALQYP